MSSPLAGRRTRRPGWIADQVFRWALLLALGIGVITLATLLCTVVAAGWPRLNPDLIAHMPSIRFPERAGAQSAITGTLWVIGCTALVALPTGILAALYLEEFARPTSRFQRLVDVSIQNLAAVPSIVYGILGLAVFVRALALGQSIAAAALTLALLVLPIIIITTREALRAVPRGIREGSLALGATEWQTAYRQTLPAALPGIATGVILAISRAAGEAAPLLLIGAVGFIAFNPDGLLSGYTTLPIQVYDWTKDSRAEFSSLAAAAIVLLLILLLALNVTASWIRSRARRRW
ncbi:MAG: phosphate ABC transporter permease PstA [Actinomycetales bacterium]|nr:phosphate ABC transporter permease PstA [Actinomycetales bacterium]